MGMTNYAADESRTACAESACYRRLRDCFFRFSVDRFFPNFGLPARLAGFFFESAGISLGRTNIGSVRRSRLAGFALRAILSSGSVSYLLPSLGARVRQRGVNCSRHGARSPGRLKIIGSLRFWPVGAPSSGR